MYQLNSVFLYHRIYYESKKHTSNSSEKEGSKATGLACESFPLEGNTSKDKKTTWHGNASEDLKKNTEADIQQMTDAHITKSDALFSTKEKEILTV